MVELYEGTDIISDKLLERELSIPGNLEELKNLRVQM
jgi:hypothetical protein